MPSALQTQPAIPTPANPAIARCCEAMDSVFARIYEQEKHSLEEENPLPSGYDSEAAEFDDDDTMDASEIRSEAQSLPSAPLARLIAPPCLRSAAPTIFAISSPASPTVCCLKFSRVLTPPSSSMLLKLRTLSPPLAAARAKNPDPPPPGGYE